MNHYNSLFQKMPGLQAYLSTTKRVSNSEMVDPPSSEPPIPAYQEKYDEPLKLKRAR